MKYACKVINTSPQERPLINYSNSLAVIRGWAKEMVRLNPTVTCEIYETQLKLVESIKAEQKVAQRAAVSD